MTDRIVGVDSYSQVSQTLVDKTTAELGQPVRFWGRYFTSRSTSGGAEYRHATEDIVLAHNDIRVLPVARQTNHVSGAKELGFDDGHANAEDLVATFGSARLRAMSTGIRIFLDVEGNGASHLSQGYYDGWTEGLRSGAPGLNFLPSVYGIPGDDSTWAALGKCVSRGVPCAGIWLSHPYKQRAEPVQWDPTMLKPFTAIPGVPVLLWQYCFGKLTDRNLVNPEQGDGEALLETLISTAPIG
jgi:hypothetical protein